METQSTDNIRFLISDLEEILNDIFLSGLGSIKDNIIEEVQILSEKCRDIGLSLAGEKLNNIASELSKKQPSIGFDYSKVVEEYYALSVYTDIIKTRL